jgi:hypothetical protein
MNPLCEAVGFRDSQLMRQEVRCKLFDVKVVLLEHVSNYRHRTKKTLEKSESPQKRSGQSWFLEAPLVQQADYSLKT